MNTVKSYTIALFTIAFLGAIAYSLYQIRNQLGIVAWVLVGFLVLCLLTGYALGVWYVVVHIRNKHNPFHVESIGEFGSFYIHKGKHVAISPIANKVASVIEDTAKVTSIAVPKLYDILSNQYLFKLIASGFMLFGYNEDGSEHTGTWDDIRTCGILGKSRYGKTVTMFFIACQCVLARATLVIIDKHFMKDSSLTKLLTPLAKYIMFANTQEQAIQAFEEFEMEMNSRISGKSLSRKPYVLMCDEFTQLAMDKAAIKRIGLILKRNNFEAAGFNMFAFIGSQTFKASLTGGNALIDGLHSYIVHHSEQSESKRVLGERKFNQVTSALKRGHMFFRDTAGDVTHLAIPLGTTLDAAFIAAYLEYEQQANRTMLTTPFDSSMHYQNSFQPYNPKLLDMPDTARNGNGNSKPLNEQIAIPLPQASNYPGNMQQVDTLSRNERKVQNTSPLPTLNSETVYTVMEELRDNPYRRKQQTQVTQVDTDKHASTRVLTTDITLESLNRLTKVSPYQQQVIAKEVIFMLDRNIGVKNNGTLNRSELSRRTGYSIEAIRTYCDYFRL